MFGDPQVREYDIFEERKEVSLTGVQRTKTEKHKMTL